jgi:hypothetical protein
VKTNTTRATPTTVNTVVILRDVALRKMYLIGTRMVKSFRWKC